MKKPIKPTKKRILQDLMQWRKPRPSKDGKMEYPCPTCNGRGSFMDPNAYCDPCEGYKMADYFPCVMCNHKGYLSKKDFFEIIEPTIKNKLDTENKLYAHEIKEYAIARKIINRCTPKEKRVLQRIHKYL